METFMSKRKRSVIELSIAVCGVFAALWGVTAFNQYLLMSFPLPLRMVLMIVTQWLLFLVPGILMQAGRETFGDLGFRKEKIPLQILTGVWLAIFMSLVLTVLPIALGFKNMVGDTSYSQPWLLVFELVYSILGVALAEELIFRGYIFYKLLAVRDSKRFAIVLSSVLFGLFHGFSGNLIQVFLTAGIGLLLCLFREKVRGCTLLSLIVAHGLYDALIVLWVSVL